MSEAQKKIEVSLDTLSELLDEAARKGAERALAHIGLNDEHAGKDVNELRDLLIGWRELKSGARAEFGRWLIRAVLLIMVFLVGSKYMPPEVLKP